MASAQDQECRVGRLWSPVVKTCKGMTGSSQLTLQAIVSHRKPSGKVRTLRAQVGCEPGRGIWVKVHGNSLNLLAFAKEDNYLVLSSSPKTSAEADVPGRDSCPHSHFLLMHLDQTPQPDLSTGQIAMWCTCCRRKEVIPQKGCRA